MSEIIVAADLNHYKNDQMNRVYSPEGIAPTILVKSGGGREVKILEKKGGGALKTLKVNDLFCGAGGMGIGFKNAGFETAGAWDFDKYAVQSYAHNVDPIVKQADITEMSWQDMPQADVWAFGFPCQDLSIAGKQAGLFEGKRSGLFFEVMRLLDETIENDINRLPDIIMAENVKGLKPYLPVLKEEYENRGYVMYHTLYNSKFWGVPQNRERYFVIGVHMSIDKKFKFPVQQEDYIPRLSTVLEPEVDEKYYLENTKTLKIIEQAKEKLNVAAEQLQIIWTDKTGAAYCCDANYFKGTAPGDVGKARRTQIVEQAEGRYKVRRLVPREYLRLQGFSDSFEIVVSDTQIYKQAGNAVTVNVAQAIAERIKMFLLSL